MEKRKRLAEKSLVRKSARLKWSW